MALADYCLCEVCGCKAWYDANCGEDYLTALEEKRLLVLCEDCAKTYAVVVIARGDLVPAPESAGREG